MTDTAAPIVFDSYFDYADYAKSLDAPLDALVDSDARHLYGKVAVLIQGGKRFVVTPEERSAIETHVDRNLIRFFTDGALTYAERND